MTKWYGKLVLESEGCVDWHEFETEAEAKAYKLGIDDAKSQTASEDDDPLEDYFGGADQFEPKDD